jgi:phosphoglycolate/pyridoxal phosphate phosphatase family enzyme
MAVATRLTRATLPSFLSSIDTFILDCDGVLWTGATPIPGAGAAVDALRAAGKRVFFCTNNSTKPRATYVETLAKFGIAAPPSAILTSAYAAGVWLASRGVKRVYLIGEPGLAAELADVAGATAEGPEDWGRTFALGGAEGPAPLDPAVGAVVCGFDGRFNYYKLMRAAAYVRAGVPFVATNRDLTYPNTGGIVPGGGCVVAALAAGAGREPDVVAGKPSAGLAALVREATGLDPARTCMVGDRLDTDMAFGHAGGYAARLLVLTGVTGEGELAALARGEPATPTHVMASIGDFAAWLAPGSSAEGEGAGRQ